ncbi:MAG: hypothetical protein NC548_41805 [Lachnospiraceae bacterium]|nr:hypothetical protein [Lachnospiraceae bacterium]
MKAITKYIMTHSNGKKAPVCGSTIASVFSISQVAVRKLINEARSAGDPICSCGKGYYIPNDKSEIKETIDSIEGRIAGMNKAIDGLRSLL